MMKKLRLLSYLMTGRKAWSRGYSEYKWKEIDSKINDNTFLNKFKNDRYIPYELGDGLDERLIEYIWIFSNLNNKKENLLDAGSTFNFPEIIWHPKLEKKNITIYTFSKEKNHFHKKNISYEYGDLRKLPFDDKTFDSIVCQSTIEHIDMDNSIYGYDLENNSAVPEKSYEYIKVVYELERVLAKGGQLLLTFPYGKYENHGFFQQFDKEMTDRILDYLESNGYVTVDYFQYDNNSWIYSDVKKCEFSQSYNPHTGIGKGDDNAAHCRAVCCIKFTKN